MNRLNYLAPKRSCALLSRDAMHENYIAIILADGFVSGIGREATFTRTRTTSCTPSSWCWHTLCIWKKIMLDLRYCCDWKRGLRHVCTVRIIKMAALLFSRAAATCWARAAAVPSPCSDLRHQVRFLTPRHAAGLLPSLWRGSVFCLVSRVNNLSADPGWRLLHLDLVAQRHIFSSVCFVSTLHCCVFSVFWLVYRSR